MCFCYFIDSIYRMIRDLTWRRRTFGGKRYCSLATSDTSFPLSKASYGYRSFMHVWRPLSFTCHLGLLPLIVNMPLTALRNDQTAEADTLSFPGFLGFREGFIWFMRKGELPFPFNLLSKQISFASVVPCSQEWRNCMFHECLVKRTILMTKNAEF